ncbi:NAD(P)H-dependent oxidoreductase [Neorhizobium galegae]|uniref:SAF domain protein n=1 Tax=Neorhizobium galegae bv. orientalis str. HAMBI 540 TaxID=1028800 RepID=A0A068T320_NEOGA|nr:SAF domain-containing protein [Neorhizobium galegae]MCQ1854189.1 SAF domain-containing protein [Neorhizobium galegae]CDN51845.1 SAF domain protein [Neorhizobium galegae bv. orientalis str. HAMBI 540]
MVYHHLYARFAKADEVKVGVIGAGNYGTAIVTQAPYTPRLNVVAVADISLAAARGAYEKGGYDMALVFQVETAEEAQARIVEGKSVYTDKPEIIGAISAVDIVCESSGVPEASVRYAVQAIEAGKHVAMVTKDCDVAVGPMLKRLARDAGVIYTPVDGDQHGLLIQFYEWAKSVGLTVLSGGKATDGEFVYDEAAGTVTIRTDKKVHAPYVETITIAEEDRKWLAMIPEGKAAEFVARRKEILARLPQPGAYDLCEITVAANYTGMAPAVDTLVHAALRITEIPVAYAEIANGGLFERGETIDLATCLRRPDESGLGGGVFLVVRCDNAYSNHILVTKGQIPNYDETAAVIYRPYHLCGVETSTSLLMAGLLGIDTGSDDYRPRYDLVKVAARDIKAGEVFGNDHSPMLTARIIPAVPVNASNPACAHLLTGNRATVDISAGTLLTYDMVEEPQGSELWAMRRLQDQTFL